MEKNQHADSKYWRRHAVSSVECPVSSPVTTSSTCHVTRQGWREAQDSRCGKGLRAIYILTNTLNIFKSLTGNQKCFEFFSKILSTHLTVHCITCLFHTWYASETFRKIAFFFLTFLIQRFTKSKAKTYHYFFQESNFSVEFSRLSFSPLCIVGDTCLTIIFNTVVIHYLPV